MRLIIILLLATACAQQPLLYRVTTTTIRCPSGYYYSTTDLQCHSEASIAVYKPIKRKVHVKTKVSPIDCQRVFKQLNQCTKE